MRFDIPAETRTVLELLEEMRAGRLDLNPPFQRRSVWRKREKSYLMDTVVRGLPVPLIILRHRLDVQARRRTLEVADGQQRLRTLFAFVERSTLRDFDPNIDNFTIHRSHNDDPDIQGKPFGDLPAHVQSDVLSYRLSIVFLPTSMEDRDVLDLFARLNSTGLRLTPQELRNANYFGELKTAMYRIARRHLEQWSKWRLFSPQEIARMKDVELVSDLTNLILNGLRPKTKRELDTLYRECDDSFPHEQEVDRRIDHLLAELDKRSQIVADGIYNREMHFYTLFAAMYDRAWGIESPLRRRKPAGLNSSFWEAAERVSEAHRLGRVPKRVAEATQGAATDLKRRRVRVDYFLKQLNANKRKSPR